jgi:hypothetical protein
LKLHFLEPCDRRPHVWPRWQEAGLREVQVSSDTIRMSGRPQTNPSPSATAGLTTNAGGTHGRRGSVDSCGTSVRGLQRDRPRRQQDLDVTYRRLDLASHARTFLLRQRCATTALWICAASGPKGARTPDLMAASHALYQLSYGPGVAQSTRALGRSFALGPSVPVYRPMRHPPYVHTIDERSRRRVGAGYRG